MTGSDENRPDPDKLLETIKEEEKKVKKGKLKIFFGMCAGVGKTYALLESAQKAKHDGIDVVIGLVETHKRIETEKLVVGLEQIPLVEIFYRNTKFKEFDLDAVLLRKPQLVLVDELAHTNIPGSRHLKRYQDVIELLDNGINVYTTLNVQHLESRAETVKQITGANIRETVPDSVFEKADEIELVDLTPDELLQRLAEGKVYTPEKSQQAIKNFFRKGNLTALREMALRLTAERVDYQLRDYKIEKRIEETWKSGQRLMVAIGPSPYSAVLIRWTRRLAYTMEASWLAVYVETDQKISEKYEEILAKNFNLAKELGAEVITTSGIDIVTSLINCARENNVTHIIIGKSRKKKIFLRKGIIERLLDFSGGIDVYVVGGDETQIHPQKKNHFSFLPSFESNLKNYIVAIAVIILLSIFSFLIKDQIGYQTVSLVLLLIISLMPLFNSGRGPIILAALLSAIIWDYFFIPPQFTFHIGRVEDVLMFAMFFIVAIVNGILITRLRAQEKFVRQREERTQTLNNLLKKLAEATSINDVSEIAVKNIKEVFDLETVIIFAAKDNKLLPEPHSASSFTINDKDWYIAQWCYTNNQRAGKTTNTLPSADALYIPLTGSRLNFGVIGLKAEGNLKLNFEQKSFLDTFLAQIITAIEREYLNEIAKDSLLISESERLYKTLFNSISHELKTPITTIMGAVSSLNDSTILENKETVKNLVDEIKIAVERLNRLVENLLDMTRLESGKLKPKLEWNDITDLINNVLNKLENELSNHKVKTNLVITNGVFKFDYGLLEQALVNLLHNCIIYSGFNSKIEVEVKEENDFCIIEIGDNGPGFPEELLDKLFEKFFRVPVNKTGGSGLGLSIAKGFIDALGGNIKAGNKISGGAIYTVTIPIIK
jgi:two-component system sensor histidine kinase KdpD